MPTFSAPEAYGKKADPKYAQARKDAEEKAAKELAKKERAKKRAREARRKARLGEKGAANTNNEEEKDEALKLAFLVVIGLFTALAEALDLDVLLGILFMPIMTFCKAMAEKFDNVMLDPQYWMTLIGEAYNDLCKNNPSGFVFGDFGFFVVMVTYILFQADINKWWAERNLRAQGYTEMKAAEDGVADVHLEAA